MWDSFNQIVAQYQQQSVWVNLAEWIALLFGIWSVWLAKKQHIGVYPVGIIATTLTMWLLYRVGFWGDMLVNLYFSVMSLYGWFKWTQPDAQGIEIKPSFLTKRESFIGLSLFILTLIVIFAVYNYFGTPMDWSHLIDLFSAGLFFVAMYFMALKKVESWMVWFIGDLIVLPIYTYRGLYLLALQYAVLTVLALLAYRAWRTEVKESANNTK